MVFNSAYSADEPEGSASKGSQYLSRKEAKIIILVMFTIFVALIPIYLQLMKQRNFVVCISNLKAISESARLYAVDNSDRLPPTYFADANGSPVLINKLPITWATVIQDKMKSVEQYKCPSAAKEEFSLSVPYAGTKPLESTYGMYSAMNMQFINSIGAPDSTILFAESTNNGALGTLNPKPFLDAEGNPVLNNGFLIGYDSGNIADAVNMNLARNITRLAFKSPDKKSVFGRHNDKQGNEVINVIFAGGGAGQISPGSGRIAHRSKGSDEIIGMWSNR